MAIRYPIGQNALQTATILGISSERVFRRAGLSVELAMLPDLSVDAATFFRVWTAMIAEANRPGIEMELAMAYAHGPFLPPIFAFSCADTLVLGLSRLADFKPLLGPLSIELSRDDGPLEVTMRPVINGLALPPSLGLFELLYITECARSFTGTHVVPLRTTLPGPLHIDGATSEFLGAAPVEAGNPSIVFSAEDADRPLITRSASLWETLEPGFREQLDLQSKAGTLAGRVKRIFEEALPGGSASIEDMARRLNLSKRSLQRRLSEEGTSFQRLLNETRKEMSERYLVNSDLNVPEISFLLGFRDTSSFFRAFQGWTGKTPGAFRSDAR